jgi:hypothetical protein
VLGLRVLVDAPAGVAAPRALPGLREELPAPGPTEEESMTETESRRTETAENAPCEGKPSGHDIQEYVDGILWVSELGDASAESMSIWEALAGGKTVTLRCRDCGVELSVGLKVEVKA